MSCRRRRHPAIRRLFHYCCRLRIERSLLRRDDIPNEKIANSHVSPERSRRKETSLSNLCVCHVDAGDIPQFGGCSIIVAGFELRDPSFIYCCRLRIEGSLLHRDDMPNEKIANSHVSPERSRRKETSLSNLCVCHVDAGDIPQFGGCSIIVAGFELRDPSFIYCCRLRIEGSLLRRDDIPNEKIANSHVSPERSRRKETSLSNLCVCHVDAGDIPQFGGCSIIVAGFELRDPSFIYCCRLRIEGSLLHRDDMPNEKIANSHVSPERSRRKETSLSNLCVCHVDAGDIPQFGGCSIIVAGFELRDPSFIYCCRLRIEGSLLHRDDMPNEKIANSHVSPERSRRKETSLSNLCVCHVDAGDIPQFGGCSIIVAGFELRDPSFIYCCRLRIEGSLLHRDDMPNEKIANSHVSPERSRRKETSLSNLCVCHVDAGDIPQFGGCSIIVAGFELRDPSFIYCCRLRIEGSLLRRDDIPNEKIANSHVSPERSRRKETSLSNLCVCHVDAGDIPQFGGCSIIVAGFELRDPSFVGMTYPTRKLQIVMSVLSESEGRE